MRLLNRTMFSSFPVPPPSHRRTLRLVAVLLIVIGGGGMLLVHLGYVEKSEQYARALAWACAGSALGILFRWHVGVLCAVLTPAGLAVDVTLDTVLSAMVLTAPPVTVGAVARLAFNALVVATSCASAAWLWRTPSLRQQA